MHVSPENQPDAMRSHSPYAATNTEVRRAITELFVMPNSLAICSLAGAIMDDETGLMNVNAETMAVAAHFLRRDQLEKREAARAFAPTQDEYRNGRTRTREMTYFLGFWGSSGPSQLTIKTSDWDWESRSSWESLVALSPWGASTASVSMPEASIGLEMPGSSRTVGVADSEAAVTWNFVSDMLACVLEQGEGGAGGYMRRGEPTRTASWEEGVVSRWV